MGVRELGVGQLSRGKLYLVDNTGDSERRKKIIKIWQIMFRGKHDKMEDKGDYLKVLF